MPCMAVATFRFYAELNDLLPWQWRQRDIVHVFREPASIKDRIEALGVPHTEVEFIQVNGAPETIAPFTRCMACNGVLRPVAREQVKDRLLPDTREYYRQFRECPDCRRVFWDGSHVRRMRAWVDAWVDAWLSR